MRLRGKGVLALLPVCVAAMSLAACVADPPPRMVGATAGNQRATVTWLPPLASPSPIVAYVVTPSIGQVAQPAVRFNSTATTQTVTGLTNGTTYTFAVTAIDALGNESASSTASNAVTPAPPAAIALGTGSSGGVHQCAVLSDGTARCWGGNGQGQLGNGTIISSSIPVPVTGIASATAISAGGDNGDNWSATCARLSDATVKCWGLGFVTASTTPVDMGITNATAAAAGVSHACALLADGTIKCWGNGELGALGNGTTTSSGPVLVTGISTATAISSGPYHVCARLSDGSVKCWGYNLFGQLGDGTTNSRSTPVTVTGITTAVAIGAGGGHTCALLSGGSAQCWGFGASGQLGNGTTANEVHTAAPVIGITAAVAIDAGGSHTCALLSDDTVKCWGFNGVSAISTTPAPVTGITTAVVIDAGDAHTCALLADAAVKCWGNNEYGQLGNGTTTSSATPVTVTGL